MGDRERERERERGSIVKKKEVCIIYDIIEHKYFNPLKKNDEYTIVFQCI